MTASGHEARPLVSTITIFAASASSAERPSRAARSQTGMILPRRLITPRIHAASEDTERGSVDFALGAQGSYQSDQDSQLTADPIVRGATRIDGYGLVNASLSLIDPGDRWKLTFLARNLFDTSYAAAIVSGGPLGSFRYQIPRDADRYFGVTARINF